MDSVFAGDGDDYMTLSLMDGGISLAVSLGSGALRSKVRPRHSELSAPGAVTAVEGVYRPLTAGYRASQCRLVL